MNILSNAIDALEEQYERCAKAGVEPEPGHIWIQTKPLNSDWVQIRIGNTGPPIPDDVRHRLFDPFFTTKPFGKGTGLGLSISYQIVVQRHQGDLTVESTAAGRTTFVITLPIDAEIP
ncbi:MAG: hypothetical protein HC881_06635 [Leptolyngbyaceae cyanobacterium SL_7_1]|nr:hypothetical protein [Leptolyngbyaceae cyanobacterium SL_7_1]